MVVQAKVQITQPVWGFLRGSETPLDASTEFTATYPDYNGQDSTYWNRIGYKRTTLYYNYYLIFIYLYNKGDFYYPNAFATAKSGVGVKTEGQLVISGTKGYIIAQSPWWLMKHFEVRYEDADKVESYDPAFRGDGLRYEISEFVRKINGTGKNGYKLTRVESIAMSEITERYMAYKAATAKR